MSLFNALGLVGRHTIYLEGEIERLHEVHRSEIEKLRTEHQSELDFVRQELAWQKEEVERLRRFLIPTIQPVYEQVRAASSEEPPSAPTNEFFGGMPWMKILRREMQEQEEEAKAEQAARIKKAAEAAIANLNGG